MQAWLHSCWLVAGQGQGRDDVCSPKSSCDELCDVLQANTCGPRLPEMMRGCTAMQELS